MDEDDAFDETVMLTRRGRRSRGADAASPAAPGSIDSGADDAIDEHTVSIEDRTVAVPRRRRTESADDVDPTDADAEAPVDEHTIAIDRRSAPVTASTDAEDDGLDDRTVAVSRRRAADPEPDPDAEDPFDDRTVAVVRDATPSGDLGGLDARLGGEEPLEDRTVVIDRGRPDSGPATLDAVPTGADPAAPEPQIEDRTVVIDRSVEDRTVAVDRAVVVDRRAAPASASPELVSADVAEDLDATVPAAPPRVVEAEPTPAIYKPRAAPRRPSRPPVIQGGIAPTREFDEQAVSLVRRARRVSLWSLLSVLGACAVSVAGLITLAYFVFA